ncbi:MAG: AraC family transcriptional regulator [Planctomycetota bacterium]|nr:AraC family transcriptional regulator [Planctomycetota bacterium]
MAFESVVPVAAGYRKYDAGAPPVPGGPARRGALLYVECGRGTWTVGRWSFPVSRGQLILIPCGYEARADADASTPPGYYYVCFNAGESAPTWPLDPGNMRGSAEAPPYVSGNYKPEVVAFFRHIQEELERGDALSKAAARAHLVLLGAAFTRMLAICRGNPTATGTAAARAAKTSGRYVRPMPEPVRRAMDFVESNLHREISLADLSRAAGYSPRQFYEIFMRAAGMSPLTYVRTRRIREARRLLAGGKIPVKEVAARLGFADQHHFCRVFRQFVGVSPSEYAAGRPPPTRLRIETTQVASRGTIPVVQTPGDHDLPVLPSR